MAYVVVVYVVMACIVEAYIGLAYIVMALRSYGINGGWEWASFLYSYMACIVMACIVMADGLYSYGPTHTYLWPT